MKDESFIEIYENAIPEGLCDRLIEKHKELMTSTSISPCRGEQANGGIFNRKDISFYVDVEDKQIASEINAVLDQYLDEYISKYPSCGMFPMFSKTIKLQKTEPKGGFHRWHCEKGNQGHATRVLVWMAYLNDTPEGEGTTEFLEYGESLQPRKGSLVFFPADWPYTHRGNPVYSVDKYIITGWYYLAE